MTTRDDIVAALERAVVQLEVDAHCFESAPLRRATLDDAVLLRALVDAVREADVVDNRKFGYWVYWIIPEPRIKT